MEGITTTLRQFLGKNVDVPNPKSIMRHRWTTDPDTLGAYSYPTTTSKADDYEVLARPIPNEDQPRLLFAGEAASPQHWSFTHGAMISGIHEANRIIENE